MGEGDPPRQTCVFIRCLSAELAAKVLTFASSCKLSSRGRPLDTHSSHPASSPHVRTRNRQRRIAAVCDMPLPNCTRFGLLRASSASRFPAASFLSDFGLFPEPPGQHVPL